MINESIYVFSRTFLCKILEPKRVYTREIYINFPFQKSFKWAGSLTFAIFSLPCRTTLITDLQSFAVESRRPYAVRLLIAPNLGHANWKPFQPVYSWRVHENETVRNSSDFIEAQTCSRSCLLRVEITLRISFCRLIVRRQEDCSISLSCSLTISSPSWLDWKPVCFDYRVRSLSLSCASDTAQCKIWGSTLRNYFIKKLIFLCVI